MLFKLLPTVAAHLKTALQPTSTFAPPFHTESVSSLLPLFCTGSCTAALTAFGCMHMEGQKGARKTPGCQI